ncbi:hypothetical protein R3P38DRAFT_3392059 [Favolaschia claudopus]|uniref:DUF6535 domain-containing protein n=1 Tax=Favolaschia claudopus TaxID=2862362 RepID=A0AAW0C8X6_9AGAR
MSDHADPELAGPDFDSSMGQDSGSEPAYSYEPGLEFRAVHFLSVQFANLSKLMTEQTDLLRRIEARQASADLSRKPMPQVPATSSSAWNPLLKSFVNETIQPQVNRWQHGLDSLLVFLGLFSAVVTSFLADSLNNLKPDEAARTNELLLNISDIITAIGGASLSNLTLSSPSTFEPDPSDIRVNSFYSLSLVLSLSIAALVVAGRGFLNMVTWSPHKKAVFRLSDIHARWGAAERILRPGIESLTQLVVIPVLLFIAAIVDVLISTVLPIFPRPRLIFVATGLCLLSITTVASVLLISSLASLLRVAIIRSLSYLGNTSAWFTKFPKAQLSEPDSSDLEKCAKLSHPSFPLSDAVQSYHQILQGTHDDDALDLAASALLDILKVPGSSRRSKLTDIEIATFSHLLSPEASTRSNRTAAEVFAATYGDNSWISQETRLLDSAYPLLDQFFDAMQRYHTDYYSGLSFMNMWDSPFIRALAVAVGYRPGPIHPVVYILSARALNWELWSPDRSSATTNENLLRLVWKVLDVKLTKVYFQDIESPMKRAEMHALIYTSQPGEWVEVDSRSLLESLIFLFEHGNLDQYPWITDFVQWIAGWASLDALIVDMLHTLHSDILQQPWVTWTMKHNFLTCIELIMNACAQRPDALSGHQMLNLCSLCATNALRCMEAFVSPLDSLAFVNNFARTLSIALAAIETVQKRTLPPEMTNDYRIKLLRVLKDVLRIKDWMDRQGYHFHGEQMGNHVQVVVDHVNSEEQLLEVPDRMPSSPGITIARPLRHLSFTRVKWIRQQGIKYGETAGLEERQTEGR